MSAAGGAARTLREATGSALLGVMMLVMMLAAITVAITLSGQTELLVARSHETSAQARAAAQAGLNHAVDITLTHLKQWKLNGFASQSDAVTALLEGPDRATGSTSANADNGSLEKLGIPRPPATTPLAAVFGVSYEARVLDEDDPTRGVMLSASDTKRIGEDGVATSDTNTGIIVQATGYGPGAATVTLEATIGLRDLPKPLYCTEDYMKLDEELKLKCSTELISATPVEKEVLKNDVLPVDSLSESKMMTIDTALTTDVVTEKVVDGDPVLTVQASEDLSVTAWREVR